MKNYKSLPFLRAAVRLTLFTTLVCAAATGVARAAQYTVTNTNDAGAGSFRQALLDANANPGADSIIFAAPLFDTPQTIALVNSISISESVTITGRTNSSGVPTVTVRRSNAPGALLTVNESAGS